MRRLYQLNFKLFIKMWYISFVPLIILGYCGFQLLNILPLCTTPYDSINYIGALCGQYGLIWFAYFLFAGYEFFRKAKDKNLQESFDTISNGRYKSILSQLSVMITIITIIFVPAMLMVTTLSFVPISTYTPLITNTVFSTILYIGGPMLIGLLIGAVGSQLINRLPFYLLGLLCVFLISTFSTNFYLTIGYVTADWFNLSVGINILKAFGLFSTMHPVYFNVVDTSFGQGLEPSRWNLLLFWICLCGAVLFWKLRNKKTWRTKIVSGILALFCAINFLGYWNTGSRWQHRMIATLEDVAKDDLFYYENLGKAKYNENKAPMFSIKSCQLNLNILRDLKGEAILTLDGTVLDSYDFTLHHNYHVTSVTDRDGNPLNYERWHDYLSVMPRNESGLTSICITYEGSQANYYSTAQGCYLPGMSCYYPVAGLYTIFENGSIQTDIIPNEAIDFEVNINTLCSVYSNLERNIGNIFKGYAKSVTLVGGMYKEDKKGGTRNILPHFKESVDISSFLKDQAALIQEKTGLSITVPKIECVIYSPNVMVPFVNGQSSGSAFLDNTLLLYDSVTTQDYSALTNQLLESVIPAVDSKSVISGVLSSVVKSIVGGDDTGVNAFKREFGTTPTEKYIYIESMSKEQNLYREILFYIYKALYNSNNPKSVISDMYQYLTDQNINMDELTFAKSLAEKYPEEAQQP